MTVPRITPGDVLAEMYVELCQQAQTIEPWDADGREAWVSACRHVLAAVPNVEQRTGWRMLLAHHFAERGARLPLEYVVAQLFG